MRRSSKTSLVGLRLLADSTAYHPHVVKVRVADLRDLLAVASAAEEFLACGPDYGGQSAEDFEGYVKRFDAAYDVLFDSLSRFDP